MKIAALLVLSILLGVCLAQNDFNFVITGSQLNKDNNKVYTSANPLMIPNNLDHNGRLKVKVTADQTVLVCINEQVQLANGISSCSPYGFLNFTWVNKTNTFNNNPYITSFYQTNEIDVYLRFGKTYFVSYQINYNNPKTNITDVRIEIIGTRCADPNKDGPNCGGDPFTTLNPQNPVTDTVKAGKTNYYLFTATNQFISQLVQVTKVDLTKQKIALFGKRDGLPLTNVTGFPVQSTVDWDGEHIFHNETRITLSFPRGDKYWFAVVSTDAADIQFTIELTIGAIADKKTVNATTPKFDSRKEQNTLTFAAAKGILNDSLTYFVFPGTEYPTLRLGVAPEDDSDDTPNVFVDLNNIPSPDSNLLANTNTSEPAHLLYVTQTPSESGFVWYQFERTTVNADLDWYVAVNSTNSFVLWSAVNGTCANNCSGHGTCDDTTGICNCNDGYEKYDCSEKVFPLVWIILIAIGGAILLAIAIGVPVSCYLKNKKKSGYERV